MNTFAQIVEAVQILYGLDQRGMAVQIVTEWMLKQNFLHEATEFEELTEVMARLNFNKK